MKLVAIVDKYNILYSKFNMLLPPHSMALFFMSFVLTMSYQYMQQNNNQELSVSSFVSSNLAKISYVDLGYSNSDEAPISKSINNKVLEDYQADPNNQKPATNDEGPEEINYADVDEENSEPINQLANISTGNSFTESIRNQQRIYIPSGNSSFTNTVSTTNSNDQSFNQVTTTATNTSSVTNTAVANQAPLQQTANQIDLQENLVASNEVNTRAEELYERRRQNVCNTVTARVGVNPSVGDFSSIGEYYRLRNGYRCF